MTASHMPSVGWCRSCWRTALSPVWNSRRIIRGTPTIWRIRPLGLRPSRVAPDFSGSIDNGRMSHSRRARKVLEIRNVSKNFGGVRAVADVSFTVAGNEIHGLIGPNGAGKTTMINLISGLLQVSSGEILVDGTRVDTLAPEVRARLGVARTFQNLRLFKNLSVRRNIEVAEVQRRETDFSDQELTADAIDLFQLGGVLDELPDSLPYGQMRRLEIVRALALRPKVLMLDEPAAGMNPEETTELFRNLTWLRERHPCAIILIDHDLKFIMSACEALTVMNMGSLLASGLPDDVSKNPEVISAYLGQSKPH